MTISSQPERTFCAAMFTASRPDAQKLLICTPPTVSGKAGVGGRDARDVHALVAERADHAEDQVGDAVLVEVREAGAQLVDQAVTSDIGLTECKRSALLAPGHAGSGWLHR